MKAIQITERHQPVRYIEIDTPIAGPGEVVVKLKAASLNHRDVFITQGLYPGIQLPVIPGSDGAGIVVEIGEGVDPVWRGLDVIINCAHNWGDNPMFYGSQFKILGMPDNGTFAEYVRVDASYLYPKPHYLSFEEAATIPLAGLTAWRALMTRAGLHQSDSPEKVLITGIGAGTALFALQFALAQGAEVWVTSGSDEKIQKAIALGAAGGVNYKVPDWNRTLMAQTGGGKAGYFTVTIDSAGGTGFAKLIDTAASGGRIAMFGGTTGNLTDIVPAKVFFKQLTIYGSTMGTEAEFAAMIQFMNEHNIKPIVDNIFPLADAQQAMQHMDAGKQFGKIVLRID